MMMFLKNLKIKKKEKEKNVTSEMIVYKCTTT